jgi:hypothetical protein
MAPGLFHYRTSVDVCFSFDDIPADDIPAEQ